MDEKTGGQTASVSVTKMVGKWDLVLLSAVLALICTGLLLVFSTTIAPGMERSDTQRMDHLLHQAAGVLAGLAAMVGVRLLKPELLGKVSFVAVIISAVLVLAMKFVPGFATSFNGSPRWLSFLGVSIQPTEIIKVVWAVYVARFVAKHDTDINNWKRSLGMAFGVCIIVAAPVAILPDVGSALIIAMTLAMMLFAGGLSKKNVLILAVPMVLALAAVLILDKVKWNRVLAHLFLDVTREGVGYQLYQAIVSIGSGGFFGTGLGHGTFHIMRHLPESESDFIVAVGAEELGFFGLLFIVTLYVIIAIRGYRIARMNDDPFRRNLAFAITALISLSAVIHLCVNVALIPAKGLVCPFMSYGGSAMVVALASIGILQRLHIDATAKKVVREEFLKSYEPTTEGEESD